MKRWGFIIACLCLAVGFTALGAWQLERRAWKLELIDRVQARIHAAPRELREWSGVTNADAYTRVRMHGVFMHERETLVQAVTERGPGWWVVTPLRTDAGVVLVNRGFVPPPLRAPEMRRSGAPKGEAEVVGLLRLTEPGGAFMRANDPAADRWYSRDVAAIARARGLGRTAPFFVDAEAGPDANLYPLGGLTVVAFRNAHLAYALTWFALAGLSLAGAAVVWRSRSDEGEASDRQR